MTIPTSGRWTPARKHELLDDIRNGRMSIEDAAAAAEITIEELASWEHLERAHGRAGLRVTRLQTYRG